MLNYINDYVLPVHQLRFLEILAMITVHERDTIPVSDVNQLHLLVQDNFDFLANKFLKKFSGFGQQDPTDPSTCTSAEMLAFLKRLKPVTEQLKLKWKGVTSFAALRLHLASSASSASLD